MTGKPQPARAPAPAYRKASTCLPPPLELVVALYWCDLVLDQLAGNLLADVPCSSEPNVCDVKTRTACCRCSQCGRTVRRLWIYRQRRLLCRRCAVSRVRAGDHLAPTAYDLWLADMRGMAA